MLEICSNTDGNWNRGISSPEIDHNPENVNVSEKNQGGLFKASLSFKAYSGAFFENPPTKTDVPPMGHPLHLKMKPPLDLRNKPPPPPPSLKHETPVHEMIPRKSTVNNNLKPS